LANSISIALADSDGMRALLGPSLIQHGIDISFECDNGRELLNHLASAVTLPDLCVVDVNMPVMSGYSTAKKLITAYPQIGVVGMTYFDQKTEERMLGSGADLCVDRRMSPDEIVSALIDLTNKLRSNNQPLAS
jgi:DNA-binding NarL/FixJ family response regulator